MIDSAPARPECRVVQLSVGETRLQVSISPLLRDGEAGGGIVILSDVTESWKAEQDKNRFVSMVAHELKSPLSAIINYINVILTGMFDDNQPKVREMLERCKVRGEALLDLVRDLLYINSREVGKVERSIEDLDLKAAIASQLEFFKVQADKRRISMELDAPFAACPVKADRGDLDRIFMNLISNGIKYNREKGVLTLRIAEAGASWDRFRERHGHRHERFRAGQPLPGVLPGEEPQDLRHRGNGPRVSRRCAACWANTTERSACSRNPTPAPPSPSPSPGHNDMARERTARGSSAFR